MKRAFAQILFFLLPMLCLAQPSGEGRIKWKSSWSDGKIVLEGTPDSRIDHVSGSVSYTPCEGKSCSMPQEYDFDLTPEATAEEIVETKLPQQPKSLWALIVEAILWGFLMLLTPCVFPMVPMTVSYFLRSGGGPKKAFAYGLFIVLLYTVPICLIIGLTWLFGGSVVTADIFNWLSTHWLPNLLFFTVFLVFALSFFGLFEIVLPSRWVNGADKKSDKGGLGGVFFMALTLVLVSFSCTGPIVGTVLIKSTAGEFWTPMITMLAFSIAFALPFALLALFPSALKKLPKSGGWMQTLKVSLGFIELALGLKFLSVADQTYHWGILPREVYLAIWIVLFVLLIFYLVGLLRFPADEPKVKWSVPRAVWLAIVVAFTVYLFSGFYSNPLKAIAGYLPPAGDVQQVQTPTEGRSGEVLIEEAKMEATKTGKKIFVDITGYGCVNCREMEARVWSDPAVKAKMDSDFIIVRLYVDDKSKLPQDQWVTTDNGTVLKDVGRVNSYLAISRFNVNSQPNYFILDSHGTKIKGPYSYNLSVEAFLDFLSD